MNADRLEILVLSRLAGASKSKPPVSRVIKSLAPFIGSRLGAGEQRRLVALAIDRARSHGLVTERSLALTDAGKERLRRYFGVADDLSWMQIKGRYLLASSLGMPAAEMAKKRLDTPEKLRGLVVSRHHGLAVGNAPTLRQAADALIWRHLGVETSEALTLDRVRALILGRELGGQGTKVASKRLESRLAARAAGAASPSSDALRSRLIQDWLFDGAAVAAQAGTPAQVAAQAGTPAQVAAQAGTPAQVAAQAGTPAQAGEVDLAALAAAVNKAAAEVTRGRFGDRKVFIAAVWEHMRSWPISAGMTLEELKQHLVRANREDLVSLHRADLVEVMPADLVAASATHYLNATFHFIEIRPGRVS